MWKNAQAFDINNYQYCSDLIVSPYKKVELFISVTVIKMTIISYYNSALIASFHFNCRDVLAYNGKKLMNNISI